MVDEDRRKFLEGVAGAIGSTALAGCSGIFGNDDNESEDTSTETNTRTEEDELIRIVEDFDRSDLNNLEDQTEKHRDSVSNHQDAYDDVLDDFNDEFATDTGQLTGVDEWIPGFQVSDEIILGYQESPLSTNQKIVRGETTYVRPDGVKPPLRSSEGMQTFDGIKQELSLPDDIYEELELNEPDITIESKTNSVIDVIGRVTPYIDHDLDAAIEDLEGDKEKLDEIIDEYQQILEGGVFNANNTSYDLEGLEDIVGDLRHRLNELDFIQISQSELNQSDVTGEEVREVGTREVYDNSRNLYIDTAESLAEAGVLRAGYRNWISQLEDTRETYGRFYGEDEQDMDTPDDTPTETPTDTPTDKPTETPDYEVERRQIFSEDNVYEVVKDQQDGNLDDYDREDLLEEFVYRLENKTGWDISDYDDLFDGDSTNPTDTTRIDLKWEQSEYGEVRNTGIKFWYNFEQEEDQFTTESLPEADNYISLDDDFGQDLVDYVSNNSLGRPF